MPESHTCHVHNNTALVCIAIDHLSTDLVVPDLIELGDGDE